jgi:hypothetical protein
MKRYTPLFITLFIVFALFGVGYANKAVLASETHKVLYYSKCDRPVSYKIGRVDTRFNISQETFARDITAATDIWNAAAGKKVIVYDPDATLTVSLEYDQRQSLNTQINQLDTQLKQKDNELKPEIADYEARAAAFKKRMAALNEEINKWNSQGGAPPEEYKKLQDEQAALKQEADNLNALGQKLNQTADQYNAQADQLNQTVDTYNQALQYKPEEGLYVSENGQQNIYIYFYVTQQETVHTLAHEMGHALGLDHINNPSAIMFSRTNNITVPSGDDYAALNELCKQRSVVEPVKDRLSILLTRIEQSLQTLWGTTRGSVKSYY